jgi:hypothetical protein
MAPSVAEIEKDALTLSPEDRARLVVCLLESLENSIDSAEEVEKVFAAIRSGRS